MCRCRADGGGHRSRAGSPGCRSSPVRFSCSSPSSMAPPSARKRRCCRCPQSPRPRRSTSRMRGPAANAGGPLALAAGLAAWAAAASVLVRLPATPLAAMAVALVAICVGQSCLPRGAAVAPRAPLSRADLAGRLVAGAALALAVTSLSGALGAAWSGILAVFPLLGSVLSVSSHRAHGPDFVIHLLRAMVLGRFSFAAFCLCVALALPHQPAIPAFVEAAALSIVVQGMTRRFAARSARPPALTRAAAPD
ncbi:membrane protein, putative [Burkholderia thailandensis E264]|uniref:Membrane protein, putative n=1 Tax=Burkholderia thailandensis (strain ATCC 700388 / DSM 13276 / CCUG 48851 / CIP 106301 / E264) TaxID=271848 RepID=Q2STJ6_BURTA|nr:membrane protein, putative [Burkholderia thailandensis E264]AOJ43778.1 hypothetical protein WJ27_00875 [Burkholderia thailandensis]KVG14526.1 hypothetical protein WJ25_01810 [Burkholderia thailandensis]KVG19899.1 hypothetical protein WJ28_03725 [Burkholderia thailandensis]